MRNREKKTIWILSILQIDTHKHTHKYELLCERNKNEQNVKKKSTNKWIFKDMKNIFHISREKFYLTSMRKKNYIMSLEGRRKNNSVWVYHLNWLQDGNSQRLIEICVDRWECLWMIFYHFGTIWSSLIFCSVKHFWNCFQHFPHSAKTKCKRWGWISDQNQ